MTNERPIPPSAIEVPEGREPQRLTLRLRDGYETSMYIHRPPEESPAGKLPVLYAHGIQSHPGWFFGSALALADAGHVVYQVTRRGSGDNTIARGDCRSRVQLLDDVRMAKDWIRTEEFTDKMHLLGVSWGGKLLTAYLVQSDSPARVASLTLISPGIVARADVQFRVKVRIAGSMVVRPETLYDIPLSDPALFTDTPAMRTYLAFDAFRLQKATARFLFESRMMDRDIHRAKSGSINCPTSLILSSQDKIIDNAKTHELAEKLVGYRLKVAIVPGAHTLEFEPDPTEFYKRIVEAVERGEPGK